MLSEGTISAMAADVMAGMSAGDAAAAYGCHADTVRIHMRRLGIKVSRPLPEPEVINQEMADGLRSQLANMLRETKPVLSPEEYRDKINRVVAEMTLRTHAVIDTMARDIAIWSVVAERQTDYNSAVRWLGLDGEEKKTLGEEAENGTLTR